MTPPPVSPSVFELPPQVRAAERASAEQKAQSDKAPLVVMKFGGTSVADAECIRGVARRIVAAHRQGARVVAVASAMGKSTDQLIDLAHEVSDKPLERELDMLLSTGERISCALIAMAIADLGVDAISLTGSQAGIVTDDAHTNAKIVEIRAHRIHEALELGKVVLVAGFQGVSINKNVTTLGRGGSDATAVALAAALDAQICEIYTDVEGVFTADPRIVPDAKKLHFISYDEMLEMAASGARVLMLRSVEFARNHGVLLHVRSSFSEDAGTWVGEADERMEKALISGVTHDLSQARVVFLGVPDRPDAAARIFGVCAQHEINVDMILQTPFQQGQADIAFTVPTEDMTRLEPALDQVAEDIGAGGWRAEDHIGLVSLVGAGLKTHPGIAARMFATLADNGVSLQMISSSPIKISCVIPPDDVERAVAALHDAFELHEQALGREHSERGHDDRS